MADLLQTATAVHRFDVFLLIDEQRRSCCAPSVRRYDRRHLPFAALAFSAVVSMIPGFFLFQAARGVIELVSVGPTAPATLLVTIAANGATAFLVVIAMTFGLILPRMLFERFLPAPP
jgi:hypothetical protein